MDRHLPSGPEIPLMKTELAVGLTESCMRIIINGAGIAGPTLAFWLRKAGHEVLLVEAAPNDDHFALLSLSARARVLSGSASALLLQ
jgi:hypothetical protein